MKEIGIIDQFKQINREKEYHINLSRHIDRPGQYELFVSEDAIKNPNKPLNAVILLQGVETPGLCKVDRVFSRMELNIAAHPTMKEGSISVDFNLADQISNEKVYLRKVVFN